MEVGEDVLSRTWRDGSGDGDFLTTVLGVKTVAGPAGTSRVSPFCCARFMIAMKSMSCIWLKNLGMDGKIVAHESADTSGLSAGHWCVTGIWSKGGWSCMNVKRDKETLWDTSTESSCDGRAIPAGPALNAGSCRAGSSTRDGPALSAVPGRQGCSTHVISGSPAESAVCAGSAVSGGPAVSAGLAGCAGSATSAGPSTRDVTCAGGTDSVDFWDTYTVRFSPLLDDLDWCVVDAPRMGVDGDTGISVEPRLPHSRTCCDDPGWPDRSARLVVSCLDREEAAGWAVEPLSLSSAPDQREDPYCPVGSRWRELVEVAMLDVEVHSWPLSLECPEDDDGRWWSLRWRWGKRRHSNVSRWTTVAEVTVSALILISGASVMPIHASLTPGCAIGLRQADHLRLYLTGTALPGWFVGLGLWFVMRRLVWLPTLLFLQPQSFLRSVDFDSIIHRFLQLVGCRCGFPLEHLRLGLFMRVPILRKPWFTDSARRLSATFMANLNEPTLLAALVVVPLSLKVRALRKLRHGF